MAGAKLITPDAEVHHSRGRPLFEHRRDLSRLMVALATAGEIKVTPLTSEFGFKEFKDQYGERPGRCSLCPERLIPISSDAPLNPKAGQSIVSLLTSTDLAPADKNVGTSAPRANASS